MSFFKTTFIKEYVIPIYKIDMINLNKKQNKKK